MLALLLAESLRESLKEKVLKTQYPFATQQEAIVRNHCKPWNTRLTFFPCLLILSFGGRLRVTFDLCPFSDRRFKLAEPGASADMTLNGPDKSECRKVFKQI